jgi:hypothetical protein
MGEVGMNIWFEMVLGVLVLFLACSQYIILRRFVGTQPPTNNSALNSPLRFPDNLRWVSQSPGFWRLLWGEDTIVDIAPLPGTQQLSASRNPVPPALNTWWNTMLAQFRIRPVNPPSAGVAPA